MAFFQSNFQHLTTLRHFPGHYGKLTMGSVFQNFLVNGPIPQNDSTPYGQSTLALGTITLSCINQTLNTRDTNDFLIWFEIFFLKHKLFTLLAQDHDVRCPPSSYLQIKHKLTSSLLQTYTFDSCCVRC